MPTEPAPTPDPPVAARRPSVRSHHGETFVDPYEWLRNRDDPAVIGYLEAENAYTEARTGHLAELVESIFGEIKARTQETDLSVPIYRSHPGGLAYWYYVRTEEGAEYPIYCRAPAPDRDARPAPTGPLDGEEVLLDSNREAAGSDFFSLGAFVVSEDGRRLAYSVDTTGDERFRLRITDIATGELIEEEIPDTAYGVAWAGDNHLCYTRADATWRPYLVLRHRLGTPAADDAVIWTEPDERFWLSVEDSRDGRFVLLSASSKKTSEYRLLETANPEGDPRIVAPRQEGVEYDVETAGDRLLIVHNAHARDFELAEASLTAGDRADWRPVLPAQPGVRVVGVSAYARHAVVSLRREGLTALHVLPRNPDGSFAPGVDISFPEALYSVDSPGDPEYDSDTVRVEYTSLLTPESVYDCQLDTGRLTLLKRTPVLDHPSAGPYCPEDYVQERHWVAAADGTRVPLSIVRRRDTPLDGSAPALLYGYGSYEMAVDPSFAISRLSLLDRGVIFAIAHVRGGGELGRSWYEQGKELQKKNTFTDFVSCARYLIESGYTAPDRLAARGASAGGLLMGAVANQAPAMFRAIHAGVPFVDPLTSILDPDLPLTVIEWEEWGDPLHDPAVYAYMKSYSPYENVAEENYPAILATTSLHDTRVLYVEPAKWVAQLRASARNPVDRPILLKTEMAAGHGGVSGRYSSWRELAFEYAWLLDQVGAG